jgi:hypothetical protein
LGSLVVVFSLAWLTAAYAASPKSGSDKSKTKNNDSGTTGPSKDDGTGKGTTGGQGSDDGKSKSGSGQGSGGQSGDAPGQSGDTPSAGVSAGAEPSAGKVLLRLTSSSDVQALDASQVIPVGARVDARRGTVTITTAVGSQGATQTASFWGGIFEIAQAGSKSRYTDIVTLGTPRSCGSGKAGAARRTPKRQLWGKDNHGKYRTHGQNSVATVRGTTWLTVETCRGTLTRVTEGAVSVHDLHTGRTVLVKAGHSHLARAGRAH